MLWHLAVVDDDPAVSRAVWEQLQQAGELWHVSAYPNGADALKAIAAALPRVVLMEQTLPDGCGFAWARRFKSRHPQLPVVIHTTKGSPEQLFQALNLQLTGYLVKAGALPELATHLRKAMAGRFAPWNRRSAGCRRCWPGWARATFAD